MKKLLFILLLFLSIRAAAQSIEKTMAQAKLLMVQNGPLYNPATAFKLFLKCAQQGNPEAMNGIAIQYKIGLGVDRNDAKAIEWFTKAGNAGYPKAWYNLGILYKDTCDYVLSYNSFSKLSDINEPTGWYSKAYMLYKGLGCQQDYKQSFVLFKKAALKRYSPAMYFLGLCYRNGYGTTANSDSAKYWLLKSSVSHNKMADDELQASETENSDVSGALADKIKAAQKHSLPQKQPINQYTKIESNLQTNQIAGTYTGYLITYDWSGKHVVQTNSLNIKLKLNKEILTGTWKEDDSTNVPINAILKEKEINFNGMKYHKKSHYNLTSPDLLTFQNAKLQFAKNRDTIYLAGNIQMFSNTRKEPSRPMYLALIQTSSDADSIKSLTIGTDETEIIAKAYPNPFNSIINLSFQLKEDCKVETQLLSLQGSVVYHNPSINLEKGDYTIPIQIPSLAPGVYILKLQYGFKVKIIKVVKL